jgi:hypothetical protein
MGSTVFSKRTILHGSSVLHSNGSLISSQDMGTSVGSRQETTSFRSGRAADHNSRDFTVDLETKLLSASNYRERFQLLKAMDGDRTSPQRAYDTGHEFKTTSYIIETPSVSQSWTDQFGSHSYSGHVSSSSGFHEAGKTWYEPTVPDLGYYGPRAINRTRPTIPAADLAVGLAELRREGFPQVVGAQSIRERARISRNAGSEYLNIEFGWKPLVSEVMSVLKAVKNSSEILKQYQRDSGKNVRRKYSFPVETSIQTFAERAGRLQGWSTNPSIVDRMWLNERPSGFVTESVITRRRVWFSGAYTYHIQSGGSILDGLHRFEERTNKLFGLRITPEVLWNLAPWSWLSDWNVNIGANIANASALASDGLVLRYGYIMVETTIDHACTVRNPVLRNGQRGPWTTTFRTIRKERFRAQPFGFGSDPASYTTRQWAILGALGMTKSPNSLH